MSGYSTWGCKGLDTTEHAHTKHKRGSNPLSLQVFFHFWRELTFHQLSKPKQVIFDFPLRLTPHSQFISRPTSSTFSLYPETNSDDYCCCYHFYGCCFCYLNPIQHHYPHDCNSFRFPILSPSSLFFTKHSEKSFNKLDHVISLLKVSKDFILYLTNSQTLGLASVI